MIHGIGIDIVEWTRIRSFQEQREFLNNILTEHELKEIDEYRDETQPWIKFAVKEAVFKAFGCGLSLGTLWHDITVWKTQQVEVQGKMQEMMGRHRIKKIHYAVAISKHYIVAVVLLEQ